ERENKMIQTLAKLRLEVPAEDPAITSFFVGFEARKRKQMREHRRYSVDVANRGPAILYKILDTAIGQPMGTCFLMTYAFKIVGALNRQETASEVWDDLSKLLGVTSLDGSKELETVKALLEVAGDARDALIDNNWEDIARRHLIARIESARRGEVNAVSR